MIVLFAGTRPEIIKVAPVFKELTTRARPGALPHFCFTGQHLELALPLLDFFGIKPDSTLDLMVPGQSLGQLTSRAAAQIDGFLTSNTGRIRATVVQGDTTTAFAAALSSFYHRLPVAHIEAGLRTSSIAEPFPEELNRRLISRIAAWHYAPTARDRDALLQENISPSSILVTGNTGIDALLGVARGGHSPQHPGLKALDGQSFVLITCHRRENLGAPLERIVLALRQLAENFPKVKFVLPVHRNPAVAATVRGALSNAVNILLTDPLEYGDTVWAMTNAKLLLSDSGGIQEEASSLKKTVLVLRNETERPEAVDYGTSILVGSSPEVIVSTASAFLEGRRSVEVRSPRGPYGDGQASTRIVTHLLSKLGAPK